MAFNDMAILHATHMKEHVTLGSLLDNSTSQSLAELNGNWNDTAM